MDLTVLNQQLAEKPVEDPMLDVQEVFLTLQGEGPFAGTPAVFVRLAGCNLQCPLCDTDYTSKRHKYEIHNLVDLVKETSSNVAKLVVITGGEPFRQRIGRFVLEISREGFRVQVETNGTLWDPSMSYHGAFFHTTLVCSPKTGSINPRMQNVIQHLKYILQAGKVDPEDGLPTESLGCGMKPARPWHGFRGTVYVQPADEQDRDRNEANVKAALASCMQFGHTLCLQLHKIIGLP